MERLDFAELSSSAQAFDTHVAASPNIDHYCSSSLWALPAQGAFAHHARPYIARSTDGFIAMMALPVEGGVVGVPLEASWGLASPFVGKDPEALVPLLAELDADQPLRGLFLSGIVRGGQLERAIAQHFGGRRRIGFGPECPRRVADIRDGIDGFMSRRSARFRANLRRADRTARAAGFVAHYEAPIADADAVFERVLDIERRCWKGQEDMGIDTGEVRGFYRDIVRRLVARKALRIVFIERDGHDRAYVFGGLFGDTYRGLQVSYDAEDRPFSLGNLAQFAMIQGLCAEGIAAYDLGTDIPYKHRWSEPGLTTATLAVLPR